jgi:tetratricopeptide (TPR) repeat protein
MKKIVFIGNCQGRRLQVLYEERFSPITGDTAEFIGNFDALDHRIRKILAEADIIVMQALEGGHAIAAGDFETAARFIEYPNVTGHFLWPFSGEQHVLTQPLPDKPDGPYGQQFGDRWLNRRIAAGARPVDIEAEYLALDIPKVLNLDRLYELVMHYTRRGDARTGFDFASIIERSFTREPLFFTPANLELRLFRPLAVGVYTRLGIPLATVEAALDCLWRAPFPVIHQPIHPSVARHFGLKFIGPDTRYRTWSGENLTFSEWLARYVRYDWNEPVADVMRRIGDVQNFDAEAQAMLAQIESALARTPDTIGGQGCYAHLLFVKGDIAGAAEAAAQAARLDPTDPNLIGTLAFHRVDQGRHEEAESLVRHVTATWPRYPTGWTNQGIVLHRIGKPAEAIPALRQAIGLDPLDLGAARYLATVLAEAGRPDQALTVLAIASILRPDAADLYGDLSNRLMQLGDFDSALVTARRASALEPGNDDRRSHLANILAMRGDAVGHALALRHADSAS